VLRRYTALTVGAGTSHIEPNPKSSEAKGRIRDPRR
jgi:hypothetical protein